jgi:hypothetical protein
MAGIGGALPADPRQHARQPRAHARRVMSRPRHFFHGTMRQRLAYTGSMTH